MADDASVACGLTFAVADLHGRLDLLEAAVEAIDEYPTEAVQTVVFLGDYIDRGPRSAEVVERLAAGPPTGRRWVCLKGNHEAMMALALRDPEKLEWWISNGGDRTIESYGSRRDVMIRHLRWIEALPFLHVDTHRVFVHAGVDPDIPLAEQDESTLLWKRYPVASDAGHGIRHVVHGHDPDVEGPLLRTGRTCLDTLAWRTGRLAVGVFDDVRPGGPIDLIEVRREGA